MQGHDKRDCWSHGECAGLTLQMMTRTDMLVSIVMLALNSEQRCMYSISCQYNIFFFLHAISRRWGRGRFFPGEGDNFLGSALCGEILHLGYSLPRRKFPGRGSVL